jgi:chemotaxis protein MotB
MAFFMVMWIMGMDSDVKDLVQGYFSNPVGFQRQYSGGSNLLSSGNAPTNMDVRRVVLLSREVQQSRFREAAKSMEEKIRDAGLMRGLEAQVEIVVTEEGLRIELMETGSGETFFDKASAALKPALAEVLEIIAPELGTLPNEVVVEGHTDALPFLGDRGYGNWELSVDRANAARALLEVAGLDSTRVREVRGHADRRPKNPAERLDPRNRRISILLPFQEGNDVEVLSGQLLQTLGLDVADTAPIQGLDDLLELQR